MTRTTRRFVGTSRANRRIDQLTARWARPACDCGHAFEPDPRWFHLSGCAYRESWRLPDGTIYRFTGMSSWRPRWSANQANWARHLHAADRLALAELRRHTRAPSIRRAYGRRTRHRW